MCGRYVITKAASKTKNIIQKNNGVADEINYNAFPGSALFAGAFLALELAVFRLAILMISLST